MTTHPLSGLLPVQPRPNDPAGLVALGGRVTPEALVAAARLGWFPWTGKWPIPWCSPDPRAVFRPGEVRLPRSLRKSVRNRGYRVTYDTAFAAVVAACAETPRPGQPGTWITPNLVSAWSALHERGTYHSVEVWLGEALVGGLVGMSLGRVFLGDSMFHRARDASKVAFVSLARDLATAGYDLIDGQAPTPHLVSLGARSVTRFEYGRLLDAALGVPVEPGPWTDGIPAVSRP